MKLTDMGFAESLWDEFKNRVIGSTEERASFVQDIKQAFDKKSSAKSTDNSLDLIDIDNMSAEQLTQLLNILEPAISNTLPNIDNMSAEQLTQLLNILEPTRIVKKTHTGGKIPRQLSQTPNAIRKRQARAANRAKRTIAKSTISEDKLKNQLIDKLNELKAN